MIFIQELALLMPFKGDMNLFSLRHLRYLLIDRTFWAMASPISEVVELPPMSKVLVVPSCRTFVTAVSMS
jgi:hypothetical protein